MGNIWRVFLGFQPRLALITRGVGGWTRNSGHGEPATLFTIAAATIPLSYLTALFRSVFREYLMSHWDSLKP